MALESGTRFGSYEVVEQIGAGGMGEVWRATDTELGRDVAIKVLPQAFIDDADRMARFKREAELLASLNHPNIATIHGLEKSDHQTVIVMELVEGPTLAERIKEGPLAPDEAMGIALQVVAALEAAHEKQIVHRDLKPANVKVREDGTVKVLDFGISKSIDPTAISGGTPVETTPAMTQTGVILGTAAYMSPEQARGKFVDQRTDIWAFGCLLYEMLTGQPLFGGEDVMLTLARVLDRDADLASIPTNISASVHQAIKLCLAKDPRKRIADIRDVRLALAGEFELPVGLVAGESAASMPAAPRKFPIVAGLIIGGLAVGVVAWVLAPQPESARLARLSIDPGETRVVSPNAYDAGVMVAKDGRFVVYLGAGRRDQTFSSLYIRWRDDLEPVELKTQVRSPFVSPDGEWIGFVAEDGQIYRVASTGGPSIPIGGRSTGARGATWGDDDTIIFATNSPSGLLRISLAGGEEEVLTQPDDELGEADHLFPSFLPGDRGVLFTITSDQGVENSQIAVLDLETLEYRVLIQGGSYARYSETGHIVFASSGTLLAIAFDLESLEVTDNRAIPVLDGVVTKQTGAAGFDIAPDGTLVYLPGGDEESIQRTVVWVDRNGNEESIEGLDARDYQYVQLSPAGGHIALDSRDEELDIWIWDLENPNLERRTFDPGQNRGPVWSRDGERIAFSRELSGSEEVYWMPADGSGAPEPLTQGSTDAVFPNDITPDDEFLLYTAVTRPRDILMVRIGDPSSVTELLGGPASEEGGTVSPDGRWLAYQSNASDQFEIYVRPFPEVDSGGPWQVSSGGGMFPVWSRSGTELFYFVQETGSLMSVPVTTGEVFDNDRAVEVFRGPYTAPNQGRMSYDVSVEGDRFLMIKNLEVEAAERSGLVVVLNWFDELRELAPLPE